MYLRTKETAPTYRPGLDRKSAYKSVWLRHWHAFRKSYPERFGQTYGDLTPEKRFEVAKLLSCGDYRNGFRKHACPECGTVMMVPFTCKSRLCLSCHRKKLYGWSMNLSEIMHANLAHFHVAFTMPGRVKKRYNENNFQLYNC